MSINKAYGVLVCPAGYPMSLCRQFSAQPLEVAVQWPVRTLQTSAARTRKCLPTILRIIYSSPVETLRSSEQYRSVGSAIANIGDIISLRSHCEQALMSRVKLMSPVKLYKAFVAEAFAAVAVSTCKNGYRSSPSAAFIV